MKKREIVRQVADLRAALTETTAWQAAVGDGLDLDHRLMEIEGKLTWLHERVDLLFARYEAMRGDITLDAAAAKRLTYAVGQFSARLDRLEAPKPRGRPRGRPRKRPAGPNGEAERTQPPPTTPQPPQEAANDPELPADPRATD